MIEESKDAATGAAPVDAVDLDAAGVAMKVYLVSRTDGVDYDEYDAFVVVAADEADALSLVIENKFPPPLSSYDYDAHQRSGFAAATVAEVDLSVRGEVLGSFNAG